MQYSRACARSPGSSAHLQLLALLDQLLPRHRPVLELARLQLVLRLLLLALGLAHLLTQLHDLSVHRRVEQQRRRLRVRGVQRLPQLRNLLLQVGVLALLECKAQHKGTLSPSVLPHVTLHATLRGTQVVHVRLQARSLVVRHGPLRLFPPPSDACARRRAGEAD